MFLSFNSVNRIYSQAFAAFSIIKWFILPRPFTISQENAITVVSEDGIVVTASKLVSVLIS